MKLIYLPVLLQHIGGVKMSRTVQALDCANGGRVFAVGGADDMFKLCSMK